MVLKASFRGVLLAFCAALVCALFVSRPAAADDVTVNFTGTGTCVAGPCSGSTVTGTYTIDTTGAVTWSFNTPIGLISGSDPSFDGDIIESSEDAGYPAGSDFSVLDFESLNNESAGDPNFNLQLAFSGSGAFDGALFTTPEYNSSDEVIEDPSAAFEFGNPLEFDLTSGSATPVATPEPSSIVLLGLGLFGLVVLRRRRSTARTRLARS
ncbi:MAG: PEP-CTERM sorting domain-containing protein [Candidatus Acidiferrales bacterium]